MKSQAMSLSSDDWLKAGRGLLYTIAGAVAAYLAAWAGTIDQSDTNGLIIVIVVSGISNLLKRFVTDNTKE